LVYPGEPSKKHEESYNWLIENRHGIHSDFYTQDDADYKQIWVDICDFLVTYSKGIGMLLLNFDDFESGKKMMQWLANKTEYESQFKFCIAEDLMLVLQYFQNVKKDSRPYISRVHHGNECWFHKNQIRDDSYHCTLSRARDTAKAICSMARDINFPCTSLKKIDESSFSKSSTESNKKK